MLPANNGETRMGEVEAREIVNREAELIAVYAGLPLRTVGPTGPIQRC